MIAVTGAYGRLGRSMIDGLLSRILTDRIIATARWLGLDHIWVDQDGGGLAGALQAECGAQAA